MCTKINRDKRRMRRTRRANRYSNIWNEIQEVVEDEMVHAESEIDESDDDDELWYDACETSDSNNCKNINSANTGDTDTAKAEDLDHKPLYETSYLQGFHDLS